MKNTVRVHWVENHPARRWSYCISEPMYLVEIAEDFVVCEQSTKSGGIISRAFWKAAIIAIFIDEEFDGDT